MHKRLSSRQTPRTSQARSKSSSLRGDSLIEVMFSIGVFGLVAIGSVGVMNRGLYTAQNSLEITMARNEIDAQAEALRFIHAAYITEKGANTPIGNNYTGLWQKIISANDSFTGFGSPNRTLEPLNPTSPFLTSYSNATSCTGQEKGKSFVINYRKMTDANPTNAYDAAHLSTASTHPRLLFNDMDGAALADNSISKTLSSAEGIWVTTVKSNNESDLSKIEYFDFYIRTCWDRLGGGPAPNTISTTIRLYNPNYQP